jgi:hypothetical protein
MALPERVEVHIHDRNGEPVQHSFARVHIVMPRKNHFDVWIGPSDARGRIVAPGNDLLEGAWREARAFIMDYVDPSEATGEVSVHPCSTEDVERAIGAFQKVCSVSRIPAKLA